MTLSLSIKHKTNIRSLSSYAVWPFNEKGVLIEDQNSKWIKIRWKYKKNINVYFKSLLLAMWWLKHATLLMRCVRTSPVGNKFVQKHVYYGKVWIKISAKNVCLFKTFWWSFVTTLNLFIFKIWPNKNSIELQL